VPDTSRVSPTAHYTAYVWFRNGLSHPALATPMGRILYGALAPLNAAYRRLTGNPDLEANLLARHRTIDSLLERAIASSEIGSTMEIAAGLSPRGLRFVRRHPDLVYLEGDLPDMAAEKARLLGGLLGPNHRVAEVNALVDGGRESIAAAADGLPAGGVGVITEGLLNYFDEASVRGLWRRVASLLRRRGGVYLADLSVADDTRGMAARGFTRLLEVFVRGRLHVHFASVAAARAALVDAGFTDVTVHPIGDGRYIARVIEARARVVGSRA
jgi:O-methyltransferase involved in polyketide biosynthesis